MGEGVCVQLLKGVMQKLLDIWALLEHPALVSFLLGICLENRPSGTQPRELVFLDPCAYTEAETPQTQNCTTP